MIEMKKPTTDQKYPDKIFSDERIDSLRAQVKNKDAESLLGKSGLAGPLKKRLAERMLEAELNHPLAQQSTQGRRAITATAAAPKRRSRPRVMCPWRFHATGFRLLSLRALRNIRGACLVLMRMCSVCTLAG